MRSGNRAAASKQAANRRHFRPAARTATTQHTKDRKGMVPVPTPVAERSAPGGDQLQHHHSPGQQSGELFRHEGVAEAAEMHTTAHQKETTLDCVRSGSSASNSSVGTATTESDGSACAHGTKQSQLTHPLGQPQLCTQRSGITRPAWEDHGWAANQWTRSPFLSSSSSAASSFFSPATLFFFSFSRRRLMRLLTCNPAPISRRERR